MKFRRLTQYFLISFVTAALVAGCMFKPAKVSTRQFTLTPAPTNNLTSATKNDMPVEIASVKMPSYLERQSLLVRVSPTEIKYFENAVWAERLDQSFQRALAADLSQTLPSDKIYTSGWGHGPVMAKVFIDVQQFDVDVNGRSTLKGQMRITSSDTNTPSKNVDLHIVRSTPSPHDKPETVATALSGLVADLSRQVGQAIRDHVHASWQFGEKD